MALTKPKDSPYYYTRFSICGIRVQESTRTTSRPEAQKYEELRRRQVREAILYGSKPSKTWMEAELRWLDEMKHKRSICDDVCHFEWLQDHLGAYKLENITKDVIENIAKEKEKTGVKNSSVNRMLALVRAVLNRAYKHWEWIEKTPLIRMRPEEKIRIRWITKEEAALLLEHLPPHLKAMARFTLATGLRAMNVSYLKWRDVDMVVNKHAVVHPEDSKNSKALGVPLNDDAIEVLKEQLGKHGVYVFVYCGKPVTQCSTRAWRKALARAGIENFRWHDLRHTWASWHVQNGTSLQELFELGGWSSFEMVLRYAHLSANHLKAAADRISGEKMVGLGEELSHK